MSPPKLKYEALNPNKNSIRILRLLPGRWIDDIQCELQTASLDDNPAYEALSYVWGNPQDTGPIIVDGSHFQATKNLMAALRRLRSSVDLKVLWVDAVCINQADNDEKTHQVGMMARIYKDAADVHVFLGESGVLDLIPEQDQAMWDDPPRLHWVRDMTMLVHTDKPPHKVGKLDSRGVIIDLPNYLKSFKSDSDPGYEPVDAEEFPMWAIWEPEDGLNATDQQRVDDFFARQQNPEYDQNGQLSPLQRLRDNQTGAFAIMKMLSNGRCLKACCQGLLDSPAWTGALEALGHLANLAWWSRAWVLQEAILPQRDVNAIYGEIIAPMGLIEDSGAILPRHYERGDCCKRFWNSLPEDQKRVLQAFAYPMGQLEGIRETLSIIKMKQTEMLKYLLDKTRFKEATDPRDKIYGLLGLLNNCDDPIDLSPDYNLPAKDLYIKVALQMITFSQSLSILHQHELRSSPIMSELPSWVPTWGPTYGSFTPFQIGERTTNFRAWPPGPGHLPHLATDTPYPDALVVQGKLISAITAVTPLMTKSPDISFVSILTSLETFFGIDHPTGDPFASYPFTSPPKPVTTSFARTLLTDQIYELNYALKAGQVVFDRAYPGDIKMFLLAGQILRAQEVGQELVLILPDGTVMDGEAKDHVVRFAEENFWYANQDRVFFQTEEGHFGSGPRDTKVGDEVWIVLGSLVPLVLRPVTQGEECRELVGYGYVHGIMDGEAAPGVEGEGGREVYLV
ncbi:heterokaryon incompatibility protein-domain-containing protein [Apiosordaria backusii]|uniref:Heterokaryon incompatibility protein-domain-containing protein n=1 Tax=Apiosordaria backusii TaxID=314023 RepID=A0AA40K3V4_9PEZI|nr:heterokaryon incompatibility protein-domain-containing protein [Apiosordaria backusii]